MKRYRWVSALAVAALTYGYIYLDSKVCLVAGLIGGFYYLAVSIDDRFGELAERLQKTQHAVDALEEERKRRIWQD